jgi:hypothetical protein
MMEHSVHNPGDNVTVEIATLPDQRAGTVGWSKPMLIVGKRPAWDTGALQFDLVDTGYTGHRHGLIAPSGAADYDAATEAVRNVYVFASDGDDLMSDGTDGYDIM